MRIYDHDISVVIQGAIDKSFTTKCIQSVREKLPNSEIVLSTWEDSDVKGLDADVIVYSHDPGGMRDGKKIDNVNRQIVSTFAGISNAKRKYVLKIRSDVELLSNSFLDYWDKYSLREKSYIFFRHKIIVSTLFCKRCLDQKTAIPVPFHLSDWFQFGYIEDIKKLWDVDLVDYSKYWKVNINDVSLKIAGTWEANNYVPESYVFFSSLHKSFSNIRYDGLDDYNSENIMFSENIFLNNIIMANPLDLGFVINKQPYYNYIKNLDFFLKNQPICMYTEQYFSDMYQEKFNEQ